MGPTGFEPATSWFEEFFSSCHHAFALNMLLSTDKSQALLAIKSLPA